MSELRWERAPSNRSKCKYCHRIILQDENRLEVSEWKFGRREKYYLCKRDGMQRVRQRYKDVSKLLKVN